jgi:hypothetical protein
MLRGLARHAGYPLHSPDAPQLPLPCVAVCHVVLIVLYEQQPTARMDHLVVSGLYCRCCEFSVMTSWFVGIMYDVIISIWIPPVTLYSDLQ